jgi:hypothetical protein
MIVALEAGEGWTRQQLMWEEDRHITATTAATQQCAPLPVCLQDTTTTTNQQWEPRIQNRLTTTALDWARGGELEEVYRFGLEVCDPTEAMLMTTKTMLKGLSLGVGKEGAGTIQ